MDPDTGLSVATWATNRGNHQAEVIPLGDIEQAIHLVPKFGKAMDKSWTERNVFEKSNKFYVNKFINMHTFILFQTNQI